MELQTLITNSEAFLKYTVDWYNTLPSVSIADAVGKDPARIAVISVDIINGFCTEGALADPRVANLVPPIVALFNKAHAQGVRQFVLTQDSHSADSVEFENYPPHCIRGTAESDTVSAFKALPFWNLFQVMPKNSINSAINTDLDPWLNAHAAVDTFIVVGDCTDLCTYQLAMYLKLRANAANKKLRVIVPKNCVDTYDLPVAVAQNIGAVPHHGDLLHLIFLYSMMLNGVEIVAEIS